MTPYAVPAWQLGAWGRSGRLPSGRVDVIVVGGGLSGCAAAVAAARSGVHVVLVEPLHLLGGQMSAAGVGAADVWSNGWTATNAGLWAEFMSAVNAIYRVDLDGRRTDTNGYALPAFAASALIVDRAWTQLAVAAGVEVVRNCPISGAEATTRGAAVVAGGSRLEAAVIVDATEDGSVLAAAGLPHRAGNAVVATDVTPPAREIQALSYPIVIRRYDGGVPAGLLFTAPPPNYERYRAAVARNFPQAPGATTPDNPGFAGFRGLPDLASAANYDALAGQAITRTSINRITDVSLSTDYLTSPQTALAKDREALEFSLAVLYYLQHDLVLPWGVATDEGYADGPSDPRRTQLLDGLPAWCRHVPIRSYLRESRRLVGAVTMTASSVGRTAAAPAPWRRDAVAVSHYPFDVHGSTAASDLEAELGETAVPPVASGSFPVALGALVPADGRRLVAAEKNLSVSRVVSGSIRVHPGVTAVGEAAGIVAAGTAKLGLAPVDVPAGAVQATLVTRRALLLPRPPDGIHSQDPAWPAFCLGILDAGDPVAWAGTSNTTMTVPSERRSALRERGAELLRRDGGRI